ncbi:MAG: acyltransferase family protein [Vicinamibacteria bacterium]
MTADVHSLPYRRELDGLRGIAILLVVLFHLFPGAFSFGYVGVDVFFVLSGYLITKVIATKVDEGRFSLAEFYRNRIRRIFPAMVVVLAASLAFGCLFLFPSELEILGAHAFSSAFFFENVRLSSEVDYWNPANLYKPLMHFWSLSIEEQFYAVWPLLVTSILSTRKSRRAGGIAAMLAMSGAFLFLDTRQSFFHSSARFWELALGGAVVWLERSPQMRWTRGWPSLLPWAFFWAAIAFLRARHGFDLPALGAVTLSTAFWLLQLSAQTDRLLAIPPLVFLGRISFPLYLWHYPILSFLTVVGVVPWDHRPAIVAASLALAVLTYISVERFFRRQTRWIYAGALALSVIGAGVSGYLIERSGGLPDRPRVQAARMMEQQFLRDPETDANCDRFVRLFLDAPRTFRFCRATSNDPSRPFFAVLGDSHARAAFRGFASELSTRGAETVLLANSGCAAFIEGDVGRDAPDMEACRSRIEQIYKVLGGLPHLSGVILAARGPRYMVDAGYGSVERLERGELHYRRTLTLGAAYTNDREYLRSIDATLAFFAARNVPTFVLLENPELGFLPKACLPRPFGLGTTRCSVPYRDYLSRMRDYRTRVTALVNEHPSATLLDPEPLFCDANSCYAVRDGQMMYSDDDHLSPAGSARQAKGLVSVLFPG